MGKSYKNHTGYRVGIRCGMTGKKKVLVVLGSGGHTAQMLKLLKLLGDKYEYEYAVNDGDVLSTKKINGRVYTISNPRVYPYGITMWRLILCIEKSFITLVKSKPDAIISAGPGLTVPLFILGKLFRKKCIFLESWSRNSSRSQSGRFCYYIADLFFIQWPDMKKLYPKAIYAGRLS